MKTAPASIAYYFTQDESYRPTDTQAGEDGPAAAEKTKTGVDYTLDTTLFADLADFATYHAELADGTPLPDWLDFDPLTGHFSGTPDTIGVWEIIIYLQDSTGATIDGTVAHLIVQRPAADDADGDGVPNETDLCSGTEFGLAVDAVGCAANQRDSDGDGVTDDLDQCLRTSVEESVDEEGCTPDQLDSDGDRVTDAVDQCPDTTAGSAVDIYGCPPK